MLKILLGVPAVFATAVALAFAGFALRRSYDPSISAEHSNGMRPTREDRRERRSRLIKTPLLMMAIFAVIALVFWGLYSFKTDAKEGVSANTATKNAEEPSDLEKVDQGISNVVARLKGETTDEATESTEEPSGTEDINESSDIQKMAEDFGKLYRKLQVDTTGYVYPNNEKYDNEKTYGPLRDYGGISHWHLTSKKMDRVKKVLAKLYGADKCGDMLGLPVETFSDWPWLYQVAGCVNTITYDDLKGLDLESDEVLETIISQRKAEKWDPEWKAMTQEQKEAQTLLAVKVAILNDPCFAKAYLDHYAGIDFIREASKGDIDHMLSLYEEAYDVSDKDMSTEPYGRLCFLGMITQEAYDKGEFWRASVTDQYFEEIGTHLCNLVDSLYYDNVGFKQIQSKRNQCLPMASSDILRLPTEAPYQENRTALVRDYFGKNGSIVFRDGVNTLDLRPEEFPIILTTRTPKPKTDQYFWLVEYRYDSVTGPIAFPSRSGSSLAGVEHREVSPELDDYNRTVRLITGAPLTSGDNPAAVQWTQPKATQYVIVVYTKKSNPNPGKGGGGTPNTGTSKNPGLEAGLTQGVGDNGTGANTGHEDGTAKTAEQILAEQATDWANKQTSDADKQAALLAAQLEAAKKEQERQAAIAAAAAAGQSHTEQNRTNQANQNLVQGSGEEGGTVTTTTNNGDGTTTVTTVTVNNTNTGESNGTVTSP